MDFELDESHRMLQELTARFVRDFLLPLEPAVLARHAAGADTALTRDERARVDEAARRLGLWGLDAPADLGGADLPMVAMIGVNEELGRTVTPYVLPPDSPNLHMLRATVTPEQRARYLAPYARGETVSAIAVSEPGAGSDPAAMRTRARRDGDSWVLDGRKIWISRAAEADFLIVMAVTDPARGARGGISAFLVDKGTPGFEIVRRIPMLGDHVTYEVLFDHCRIPSTNLLGEEGGGFAPMQLRLSTRRLLMSATCVGIALRALDMMREHAGLRATFGVPLAERQTIQWWAADAATRIHACRLMAYDAAWKVDRGREARTEISMVKVHATELAWDVVDRAMQAFGAMGMTRELPLHLLADRVRLMRIYDGPSEIHRWVVARDVLGLKR
jgi:acyl-CoA dehydrogenase